MNYSDLVRGALLHDIGKFIMRAETVHKMNHQARGATWLNNKGVSQDISTFAACHHKDEVFQNPTNETVMVYEADNLSSGERPGKRENWNWQDDVPLMSVFSKVSQNHKKEKPVYNECWRYHRLEPGGDLQFPAGSEGARDSYTPDGYERLVTAFESEFDQLLSDLDTGSLLMLLEKYTSFVPSETRVVKNTPESNPDVSLFDHLKTTAAITACLYKYFEETRPGVHENLLTEEILDRSDNRYMLVGGDFSGVQKFIYTITSKGALKTLRARSFLLELMTEHTLTKILERTGLPRTNIIYSGGGRFYILAPNTESCKKACQEATEELNNYFFRNYQGQLYLALDKVEFPGSSFMAEEDPELNIAELWEMLGNRLQEKKKRKFIEKIQDDPASFWTPAEPGETNCTVCHRDINTSEAVELTKKETGEEQEDENIRVCKLCRALFEMGDKLPGTNYIAVYDREPAGYFYFPIEDKYYTLYQRKGDIENTAPQTVYVLNSWDVGDYSIPGAVQLFTGNYYAASKDEKSFKGFDPMSKEAVGADRIGILRLDVDNLGVIFNKGLFRKERTFSRLSTLSRNLNQFFKFHINDICRGNIIDMESFSLSGRKKERNVTVVYAGGDDLFLVGSWDDAVEVSFDIYNCFRRYSGWNPDVTLSGGVVVQGPKYPLYKLADIAGEAEEKAKDNDKNSISLFYVPVPEFTQEGKPLFTGTFKWGEAQNFVDEILKYAVDNLSKKQNNHLRFDFSKAFLHRLGIIADIWRREGKLYLPKLAYVLARERDRIPNEKKKEWDELKCMLYKLEYLSCLKTVVTWMDLLSRRGTENDSEARAAK